MIHSERVCAYVASRCAGVDMASTSSAFFSLAKSDEPCGFTVGVKDDSLIVSHDFQKAD